MLVVLLEAGSNRAVLDTATAERLANLGVTHVSIARDQATEAVVLEGWAFDVASRGAEATSVIGGDLAARALQPVLQTLLTSDHEPDKGLSERQPPTPRRATSGSLTGGTA